MWKNYDVQPLLLLPTVLHLRLLFRKLSIMVRLYLLPFLDVGIALEGLIAQVIFTLWSPWADYWW